jgi:hypothetical protein
MRLVVRNMGRFFVAERDLLLRGFAPINPAADFIALMMAPEWFIGDETVYWETLMAKDEALVKSSNGLYLLPNWLSSKGAVSEYYWARQAGIYYSEDMDDVCEAARAHRDAQ